MPSPEHFLIPRTSSTAAAAFPPLMGWDFEDIGGLWGAPLLPAPPTPSAHHVRGASTPPRESLSGRSEAMDILLPASDSWTLPRTPSCSTAETLCLGQKTRIFPGSYVTEHSDFPRGEITAALLLRKKRVPVRVRHAPESTRHLHKNHHA